MSEPSPMTQYQIIRALDLYGRDSLVVGSLPRPLDYVLESPDSVPEQLRAFAARGFERRNRWS